MNKKDFYDFLNENEITEDIFDNICRKVCNINSSIRGELLKKHFRYEDTSKDFLQKIIDIYNESNIDIKTGDILYYGLNHILTDKILVGVGRSVKPEFFTNLHQIDLDLFTVLATKDYDYIDAIWGKKRNTQGAVYSFDADKKCEIYTSAFPEPDEQVSPKFYYDDFSEITIKELPDECEKIIFAISVDEDVKNVFKDCKIKIVSERQVLYEENILSNINNFRTVIPFIFQKNNNNQWQINLFKEDFDGDMNQYLKQIK